MSAFRLQSFYCYNSITGITQEINELINKMQNYKKVPEKIAMPVNSE